MLPIRDLSFLLLLCAGALLSLAFALISGSVPVPATQLPAILAGEDASPLHQAVILDLRLPRALTAFVTGAMLSLAGALMQVLLRNPLADPYILGISGGAAFATLTAMLLGSGGLWLSGSALGGALLTMLLVFALAHGRGSWTTTRLLLTGVVVAAGWGAMISLVLSLAPAGRLHGMLFWLMGDLSQAQGPGWNSAALLLALLITLLLARDLNILARGDSRAASLGIAVTRLRYSVYFLASLLTALAVTLAGSIGFVGLVIPHMIRLLLGSDHRLLLPASVLLGGSLLVLADTLARTLFAPQQLPVGVITALLGVPLFLFLLQRGSSPRRGRP